MNITENIQRLKGERKKIKSQLMQNRDNLKALQTSLERAEEAREIVRTVGLETQQQLEFHISDITSLALDAVFEDNPYQLKVEFVQRRNKTECDLLFVRDGNEIEPLEASGYGAVDVASFALRVASWSMKQPRSRNVLLMDEPMRNLSEDRQPAASRIIKELSERLGIQFIIVTHKDSLSQYADKLFKVGISDGKSKVI